MKVLIAGVVLMLAGPTAVFADAADSRYQLMEEGAVVFDSETGLYWARCSVGQQMVDDFCSGRANRYTWDQANALDSELPGNGEWRLPTVEELQTLVEYRVFNPAIDPEVFPNTPPSNFWSSWEAASDAFYAWTVHFANGFSNWRHKRQRFEVRLVRDGE